MIPFALDQDYRRRTEIHGVFKGQQYGGISTPADFPFVFLFTGEEGLEFGYNDSWAVNGEFLYYGEGQVGDMQFSGGNLAIRDHRKNGTRLLLFSKVRQGVVRFLGQMHYVGHDIVRTHDRNGAERAAIRFRLVSDSSESDWEPSIPTITGHSLAELRRRAMEQARNNVSATERRSLYRRRSIAIKQYALKRAAGTCEACGALAPFQTQLGLPFLEVHHLDRLVDDGPDEPSAVAGVCPNCHRRVHCGSDGFEYNETLRHKIREKELRIAAELS